MAPQYLDRDLDALAVNGRPVVIGMRGGVKEGLNLGKLMAERAAIAAASLRARCLDEKVAVVVAVREAVWPLIESGTVKPVIDRVLPIEAATEDTAPWRAAPVSARSRSRCEWGFVMVRRGSASGCGWRRGDV